MRMRGLAVAMLAACGKIEDVPDASLVDASTDVVTVSDAFTTSDASIPDWNDCDAGLNVGYPCESNGDCCSQNCFQGTCQRPPCTSVGVACASSADCCSGLCTNGACASTNNAVCAPLGNACAKDSDCCSQTCRGSVCVEPTFCGLNGDVCVKGSGCCTGLCAPTSGLLGMCGGSSQMCVVAGMLCASFFDGGVPACGGPCCSRNCVPWGAFGVLVCEPESGCHPSGELCHRNSDCCDQVCIFDTPDAGSGLCSNPTGCKPNGNICRIATSICNATSSCCSGLVDTADTCQPDDNGTLRCSIPRDGGACLDAGSACATSSDCCNRAPCVPNGDAGLNCYNATCVPNGAACTTDADCCRGTQCYLAGAGTTGTCRALGMTCALVGQACSSASDCCNGVPCTSGRCGW